MQLSQIPVAGLTVIASTLCKRVGEPSRDWRNWEPTKSKDGLLQHIRNVANQHGIDPESLVPGASQHTAAELNTAIAAERVATAETVKAEHTKPAAANRLAEALAELFPQQPIDREQVAEIATEIAKKVATETLRGVTLPLRIELTTPAGEVRTITGAHKQFPLLLKAMNARNASNQRLNVWLTGPAGSGKTTAAHQAAEALGLPFYFCGAIDTEYKLLGYTDANGKTVKRQFREAFSKPSVFLFDEVDSSGASAVLALNAALANGSCDFPDAVEQRHPDCCIIAAANTFGNGGTHDYCGRVKQDAAFLDRFVMIAWEIDEAIEAARCDNAKWLQACRTVRRRCAENGIKHIISPRAADNGAALLREGLDWPDVVNMVLRKGLDSATWQKVAP